MIEAETRSIFDWKMKKMNFAKRRTTDLKGNSRVFFPKKAMSWEVESNLQTLRTVMMAQFKQYTSENCGEGGVQKSNLTPSQARGLKSLRKRVKEGELVVIPTDKSGNLAVLSRSTYLKAGLSHTKNDKEVTWSEVRESQRELNGHVSMLVKTFKIGSHWKHGFRVRETMMGENQSVCPLSLLYKDHKGWSPSKGTVPPTRPVAGGHLGINLHISEIVSDLLDPVVALHEGGKEVISTEDMLAQLEIKNDEKRDWSSTSYWAGMRVEEYRACEECVGEEDYVWRDESPELCGCECNDGIDEHGCILITRGAMKGLRRSRWEEQVGWSECDLDRKYGVQEVLQEDIQDQTTPMVVVGTDVINL